MRTPRRMWRISGTSATLRPVAASLTTAMSGDTLSKALYQASNHSGCWKAVSWPSADQHAAACFQSSTKSILYLADGDGARATVRPSSTTVTVGRRPLADPSCEGSTRGRHRGSEVFLSSPLVAANVAHGPVGSLRYS